MAKQQSTHSGHCQICCRLQKLPGDRLSKHGYTKEYGFFNGTCFGSDALPFEKDISLIHQMIKLQTENAKNIRATAAKHRATPVDINNAWIYHYKEATWARGDRHSYYMWIQSPVIFKNHRIHYMFREKEVYKHNTVYNEERMMENLVEWHEDRAKAYDKEVEAIDTYIAMQKARIKGWKPHPEKLIENKDR